ncbi:MAG: hypothetical protein LBR73_03375 [Oscillospiraceae bacterium]|jgi:penicillin-binding protein 2|nr:hypothetical protein [Oscillospiraceae bacterium]
MTVEPIESLRKRTAALFSIIGLILSFFIAVNIKVQVLDGKAYANKSNVSVSSVPIKAARGVILDRNGIPLIENRSTTDMIFEAPFFPSVSDTDTRNKEIISLIRLFEENETEWRDNLPIILDAQGVAQFKENADRDITLLESKDYLKLNAYATAQNCFDALVKKYKLEPYSAADARKIASVQFGMYKDAYSTSNPYVFAQNVGEELISKVLENSLVYKGVSTQITPERYYVDGTIAPHILGYVGSISPEDYAAHKSEGYKMNDVYGAAGIERYAESYLRGQDGKMTVEVDDNGSVTKTVDVPAKQGNTVILTIDSKLQHLIEQWFPKYLKASANTYGQPPAGAVVVLDVNTFEILACVSTPGYDVSTYQQNRAALNADTTAPLYNRALLGSYEPGSTIKVSVALAALQEGLIDESYTWRCTGVYNYGDSAYHCPQLYLHRGALTVKTALVDSCNTFFYNLGAQLQYDRINSYRRAMGLGQKTGIELSESLGVMESPERRQSLGQQWYAGYNVQTAIGQSNLFTPIQMAVYAGTIANNGTRYRAHFIQSIRDANSMEPILQNKPEILGQTGVDKENYDIVKDAMITLGSSPTSTAGRAFASLPVVVAAKTGTSQVTRVINGRSVKMNNGIFISFAPADKPEIAVIAVGELCKNSSPVVPTVAEIYKYYFSDTGLIEKGVTPNTLLG